MIPVNICCPNGQPTHVVPSHFDVTGARGYHFRVCRAADKIQQTIALLEEASWMPADAAPGIGDSAAHLLADAEEFLQSALDALIQVHEFYYDVVDAPRAEGVE